MMDMVGLVTGLEAFGAFAVSPTIVYISVAYNTL